MEKKVRVHLGCGPAYRDGWVNVDFNRTLKADLYFDLNKKWKLKSHSVDEIYSEQVIEHIQNLPHFLSEMNRVLKKKGTFTIITPNPYFWRTRLAFLFGNFQNRSVWHINHCWLIKPSGFKFLLDQYNLRAKVKGKGLLPFPDLFYNNVSYEGYLRNE